MSRRKVIQELRYENLVPGCQANGVTVQVTDVTDATATLTIAIDSGTFIVGSGVAAATGTTAGVTFTPAAALTTAASSFTVAVTGLTSGEEYTFSASGLATTAVGTDDLTPASSTSDAVCTSKHTLVAFAICFKKTLLIFYFLFFERTKTRYRVVS